MAGDSEDTIGCIVLALAVAGGSWWLWNKYEIKERAKEPPPITISALPRRTEPFELTRLDSGAVWMLDPTTIAGPREKRQAWITIDYTKDKTVPYRTAKVLKLVDCSTGAVKDLSSIAYNADGKSNPVYSWEKEAAEPHYYPPGTVGASVPAEICRSLYDPPASGVPAGSSQ